MIDLYDAVGFETTLRVDAVSYPGTWLEYIYDSDSWTPARDSNYAYTSYVTPTVTGEHVLYIYLNGELDRTIAFHVYRS